jgi:hypothetical protein
MVSDLTSFVQRITQKRAIIVYRSAEASLTLSAYRACQLCSSYRSSPNPFFIVSDLLISGTTRTGCWRISAVCFPLVVV